MMYEVYVGGYQSPDQAGIHHLHFDSTTGSLSYRDGVLGIENPSYLYWDRARSHLYAVSESSQGPKVFSYRVQPDGSLVLENSESSSGGSPCHLMETPDGRALLTTNYMGGSVDWFHLDETGRLFPRSSQVTHVGRGLRDDRQSEPHPHSSWVDPSGSYILVPDLGLDRLVVYQIDPEGQTLRPFTQVKSPAGSGPRHLVFHPQGGFAYVINELNSTVSVYRYSADPFAMELLQTVPALPEGFDGESDAAHIAISADGTKLYASNRGHDSVAVFEVDPGDGTIHALTHIPTLAKFPRHFALTPDQRWLLVAGQKADLIEVLPLAEGIPVSPGATFSLPRPTAIVIG